MNVKNLKNLNEFRSSEQEIRNSLDSDVTDPKREPASQRQIRYVYVLLRELGYDKYEREAFEEETDFHYMTQSEIRELIDDLQEQAGIDKKKSKAKPKFDDTYMNKNKFVFGDLDDDLPF